MRKLFVLIAAGALLVAFTVPAVAEWEFNGRVAFRTFMVDDSKEAAETQKGLGPYDDSDLYWGRYCDNWIGATVTAGDITGRFMYRPLEAHETIGGGDFAQLSASYDFGTWSFLIGKDLGPVNFFPSGQVYLDDMGLVGFGGIFTYFKPIMQGTFGNLKIALAEPETSIPVIMIFGNPSMTLTNNPWAGDWRTWTWPTVVPTAIDCDTSLPKIEASYSFSIPPASLYLCGGYQSYDEVDGTDTSYSIDSYIIGLGFKIDIPPFYVNGDVFTGQNLGQYHTTFQAGLDDAQWDPVNLKVADTDTMGYCLVVGWKPGGVPYSLELGYGHTEHDGTVAGIAWEDPTNCYYIQMPIEVATGFIITPEVGIVDWDDFTAGPFTLNEGDQTYYGARWQLVF